MPGYIYSAPEILELEKEKLFMRDWLCMAPAEEIENPGDYMTSRVLGEPMIIARNEKGEINAFANVCRHRGVEVASGAGNLNEFSCPYHGWTYDLEGKLVGAPYMKEAEGFDPKSCRLSRLKSDQWAGWIFVTFNDEAEPLREFIADYIEAFDFIRQEDLRLADKMVVDLNCNWKFVSENVMDLYHVYAIHLRTFGGAIDIEAFPFHLRERGGFKSIYDAAPMVEGREARDESHRVAGGARRCVLRDRLRATQSAHVRPRRSDRADGVLAVDADDHAPGDLSHVRPGKFR